jgi:hypothetical protein
VTTPATPHRGPGVAEVSASGSRRGAGSSKWSPVPSTGRAVGGGRCSVRSTPSLSCLHLAAEAIRDRYDRREQRTALYYFGDHDPERGRYGPGGSGASHGVPLPSAGSVASCWSPPTPTSTLYLTTA